MITRYLRNGSPLPFEAPNQELNTLQIIKDISDQLALIGATLKEDEIIIPGFNGLGSEFKEITVAVRGVKVLLRLRKFMTSW